MFCAFSSVSKNRLYPHGLDRDKIPLVGRIVKLGDVYDALTSKRCYKEAFPHAKSREIIVAGREKEFDPDVGMLLCHQKRSL